MSSPSPRTGFRWPPLGAEGLAAGALLLWLVPAGFTATKVLRTAPDASVFDVLVCAANNAAYALGSAVVFGAAAWLLRRRKAAAVVAPLFSLWCVTFLTLAQIEHQSWAHSGTLLDWKLLLYTAEHWGELSAVVQSEANTATWIALVLVGALGVLPAVVSWATTRWPVPPRVVRRGAVALGV
ncbi:MAG: hypothetical protein KC417_14425, partial [Myxococcales bacterium]|nr:hypothetical protein [Myxococcales bacterium]